MPQELPPDHPYLVAMKVNAMRQALGQSPLPMPPAPAVMRSASGREDGPGAERAAAVRAHAEAMVAALPPGNRAVVDPTTMAATEAAIRSAAAAVTEAVTPDPASQAAQALQQRVQDAIAAQLRELATPPQGPPAKPWEPEPRPRGDHTGIVL
ncbi:hypothetical protein [Kineococcus radiotolerans]|uniref:Uncharacterized protein n=1 Tax=Kineococcus radiotolerans (strain ATCC BAA-149 / DSM 14245 / SRS30216) TaxID=266940 RepID=A6WH68_KINRD|nr:hypothetical protein [Kineococcus radiotolerans]ABS06157.1 hypothetical protein Krad_4699 [Kineococcus radiotolerans SRS30216 = ATCC BAA-149]